VLKGLIFDVDEKRGKVKLTRIVDLAPYLLANKQERILLGKGFSKKRTLRKIASIPLDVLIKHGIDPRDDNALRKFLREHPEYRCSEGDI